MPTTYSDIVRNPHFNRFAAIMRVPTWGTHWKRVHADVPFWTLLKNVEKMTNAEQFAQDTQPWLSAFTSLLMAVTQADERLFYTEDDMDWLIETLASPDAPVAMSLLLAMGTATDRFVTPAELAAATETAESGWRNKAAAGDIPGALKKGKQWLLPLSGLRSIGVRVPDSAEGVESDEVDETDREA